MLCVWVHGCDPGRVSDGSRLAPYQTLSIECPFYILLACALCYYSFFLFVVFTLFLFVLFLCSRWSFVDVPLLFSCSADHVVVVPDWQSRILLGMVETRSVNVKTQNILKNWLKK